MEKKNKIGRPKFVIDYEQVEKLASIMCTVEEIASFLGCHRDTLYADPNFSDIYKKGLNNARTSLRHNQYELSKKNPAMAIWLGKQYLNQRDSFDDKNEDTLNKLDKLLEEQKNA